jgi:hypothetical protein
MRQAGVRNLLKKERKGIKFFSDCLVLQVEQGQLGLEEPPAGAADQSRQSRDLYVPSATASWRMNMLTQGNLPDDSFRQIKSVMQLHCLTRTS